MLSIFVFGLGTGIGAYILINNNLNNNYKGNKTLINILTMTGLGINTLIALRIALYELQITILFLETGKELITKHFRVLEAILNNVKHISIN